MQKGLSRFRFCFYNLSLVGVKFHRRTGHEGPDGE